MTDIRNLPRTVGDDAVFDKVYVWIIRDEIFVRVEGMGNVRTLVFPMEEVDKVMEGKPVNPDVEMALNATQSELKRIKQDLDEHKILLGKSIKSLERKKDRVEKYCKKKKGEIDFIKGISADLHSREFIKSCTTFSKSLLEFLEKR